jgi:hypothetical protein
MAVDRYNTRRNLVLQEANAIASAYRHLETLDEEARAAIRPALLEYLAVREAFSEAQDAQRLALTEARTETGQLRLWSNMVKALGGSQPSARINLDLADRMFDVAASRRAALEAVVPATVLFGMLLYAVIAALLMGYSHPIDRRFLVPSSVQFVLLAIALALIVDIDRPRSGLVEVDQAPLLRTAASIRRAEAARRPVTDIAASPSNEKPD